MRFDRKGTWAALLLIVAAMALVVAGCGGGDDDSGTTAAAGTGSQTASSGDSGDSGEKVTKFAIASPEKGNDFGWNQQGVEAAKKVAQDMGIEVEVADGSGYDNVDPILSQLSSGAQFVIAHASGYNASAVDVATKTGVPEMSWDNPEGLEPGLVGDAETASQQGAYLAGVLAAKMSKSGTIGIVTSADDTNWNKMSGGFIAGARSVNPDIKILSAQIGQAGYADSAGGKRVTKTVIAGGADVIIGMGDGSSFGMLQAVEQSNGAKFIDVIGDKSSVDKKGVLLSSVLWNFEPAFKQAIEDINAGTFGEKGYTLDLKNGGISLLKTDLIPDDVWSEIEDAKQKIISGEVEVPLTAKKGDVQALLKK
jgi:simple sugar transport system substrate-binding protein